MKKRLLLAGSLATSLIVLFSFSNGPTSGAGDKTGSPLSVPSMSYCNSCHSGGNFNPTISLEVLDGQTPVDKYIPGETYRMRVTVTATSGDPAGYGFQAVALTGQDNANAGMFNNPSVDAKVTPFNDRMYAEHNKRSTMNAFEVDWVAPTAGTGDVRFYASGNVVNGANGSAGDSPVRLLDPLILTEDVSTATQDLIGAQDIRLFPNPVQQELTLSMQAQLSQTLEVQIFSLDGRSVHRQVWPVQAGGNTFAYDASALPAGVYALRISDGHGLTSRLFVKK